MEHYQKVSLKYSFPEVDNCLTSPYKDAVSGVYISDGITFG